MSKRYNIFPQEPGNRKKAKLDFTTADHNFFLNEEAGTSKGAAQSDNWGDDNDDEMLLLASQVCEQAYSSFSSIPDYSLCMKPTSTSTQFHEPDSSNTKEKFVFKKPSSNGPTALSTNLKDKCNRISSPLPGISKIMPKVTEQIDLTDDLLVNDIIYKGQDFDSIYRQFLQLQEENAKLKSQNGNLLEKCLVKDGETSILRTQLKSSQMAVDSARMDKIKTQEKIQAEWTEKLTSVNNQILDLRSQLDFKNLEIISIKERCRMLESSKVKLTQVTIGNNDVNSLSHRFNNSFNSLHEKKAPSRTKQIKTTSVSIQTETASQFIKLNKTHRTAKSELSLVLPLILEPTAECSSVLEYNEKLLNGNNISQNKCHLYTTQHRFVSGLNNVHKQSVVSLSSVQEDLTFVATQEDTTKFKDKYVNILKVINKTLLETQHYLETVSKRMTNAFQREMDERYLDLTAKLYVVQPEDLLRGSLLFKDEQGIRCRRVTALLALLLKSSEMEKLMIEEDSKNSDETPSKIIDILHKLCHLLDANYCSILFSGLLCAITYIIDNLLIHPGYYTKILDIVKCIIRSRPMSFVCVQLGSVLRKIVAVDGLQSGLCRTDGGGNLRVDYDQGVLLYRKDSCHLQVYIKQLEAALKCIEKEQLVDQALTTTQDMLALYSNMIVKSTTDENAQCRCDCLQLLIQGVVYSLRICSVMMNEKILPDNSDGSPLLAVCRSGLQVVYQSSLRDAEFSSHLNYHEGHLIEFCQIMKKFHHPEIYVTMLTELSAGFQLSPEEGSSSLPTKLWLNAFQTFSIVD